MSSEGVREAGAGGLDVLAWLASFDPPARVRTAGQEGLRLVPAAQGGDVPGRAALASEAARVAAAVEGERDATLNTAAYRMGQLVGAGHLDQTTVREVLTEAGLATGQSPAEVARALRTGATGGLTKGIQNPRRLEPRTQPAGADVRTDGEGEGRDEGGEPRRRRLVLTSAAGIALRPVSWQWQGRVARGTLALLAGREGAGKSTFAYWYAAQVTRGELLGDDRGRPRGVLVCATEDSWESVIAPRLLAAGADLERVFRVDVRTAEELTVELLLPRDVEQLEDAARQVDAGLLVLDPLMSRLDGALDAHKDGEVRRALEPLTGFADRTGVTVLALIHHNKSRGSDPLNAVMASRAFTAVARSVLTVVQDADDETGRRRLLGLAKNNLGPTDLPVLGFTPEEHRIRTEAGDVVTSRLVWGADAPGTIHEAMQRAEAPAEDRSATAEAAVWLVGYLEEAGEASKADLEKAGRAAGHSGQALRRARERVGVQSRRLPEFGGGSVWFLPTSGDVRVSPR